MSEYSKYAPDRHWRCGVFVSLLIAVTAWTSAWPWGLPRKALPIVVREGQLSVDLHEASVREVLAAIGRQANIHIAVHAADRTVNAQFSDLVLDQGLRRLLRAAALNFSLLYTRDSHATDILREVHVLGEAGGQIFSEHDQPPHERVRQTAAVQHPPLPDDPAGTEPPGELGPSADLESSESELGDEALLE